MAALAVLVAPRAAALTVLLPVRSAFRALLATALRASPALVRTLRAVARVALEPVGEAVGSLRRSTVAITSPTALTPPWAMPLTVSPMRSTTPAAVPAIRLPGGTSGARGCGWVGATFLAASMASPRSLSALRPSSSRTIGKYSSSSSFTW